MCAKACGAEEGRECYISLCVMQQGCYHALTCLQKRGGSQICGGAAASGVFQVRHGARAAEAVTAESPLHTHTHKHTTLTMTANHNTQGLMPQAAELSRDATKQK